MMVTNRYKHLTLATIALVVALIVCPFLGINAVLAQEPRDLEQRCEVLRVDNLNTNELEPLDPARFNRGKVTGQSRDLASSNRSEMPDWQETGSMCPQWEELEVLGS